MLNEPKQAKKDFGASAFLLHILKTCSCTYKLGRAVTLSHKNLPWRIYSAMRVYENGVWVLIQNCESTRNAKKKSLFGEYSFSREMEKAPAQVVTVSQRL